jgi:hypothetical protein
MKKSLILLTSVIGGLLVVAALLMSASAMADSLFPDDFKTMPVASEVEPPPEMGSVALDVPSLASASSVDLVAGIEGADDFSIPEGTRKVDVDNYPPAPGKIITITYIYTPQIGDGENWDLYIFYAPKGWTINQISDSPAKNTTCAGDVTQAFSNAGYRSTAYWGRADLLPDLVDPPGQFTPSECGVWVVDSQTTYEFWVELQVSESALTCPGAPEFVGTPFDPDPETFTYKPVRDESINSYLHGDGTGVGSDPEKKEYMTIKHLLQLPCFDADITLVKLVGEAGDCPFSSKSEMDVPPGTEVEYCFLLGNNQPYVATEYHLISDTLLGSELFTETIPFPGDFFTVPYVITGEVGTSVTNVATWTAVTTVGFGQEPVDDLEAAFTFTQYYDMDAASAVVNIISPTAASYDLFLPLIANGEAKVPEYPKLVSPLDNEELDTLIPQLEFDPGPSPADPSLKIYWGTQKTNLNNTATIPVSSSTYNFRNNLDEATKYYWKACFVDAGGMDTDCSATWSFTTGSEGDKPAKPALATPANGATGIPLDNMMVTWNAVAGAIGYHAAFYVKGEGSSYGVITNMTSVNFSDFWSSVITGNTTYGWYVRAVNDYAWGDFSDPWEFTTAAALAR